MLKIKKTCFVIMPFSITNEKHTEDYWTNHFEKFLKHNIERDNPVFVERSSPVRGDIIIDIISKLISSYIVVADLTDANSNVYWELGVRQSFKHGTITIAEYGTKLPFDISGKGTLFYFPDNHIKNTEFISNLNKAITDCIENPERPDSRVLETITGRGSFYEIINKEEISRKLNGLLREFESNKVTYKAVLERATKNKSSVKRKYSTRLFRLTSIELLLSTRYLSSEGDIYGIGERYFDHLYTVNGRLQMWPLRDESVDNWLIRVMDYEKVMLIFSTELTKIINEM